MVAVADIDPDNALVVEEQFGPALPIVKYTDLDWAIARMDALEVLGSGWVEQSVLSAQEKQPF